MKTFICDFLTILNYIEVVSYLTIYIFIFQVLEIMIISKVSHMHVSRIEDILHPYFL